MNDTLTAPAPRQLRLWPGVAIIVVEWLVMKVPGWVAPGTFAHFYSMFLGPLVCAVLLVVWWLFFSRLRWADRLLALVVCILTAVLAVPFYHPTIKLALGFYAIPAITTAWVAWLLVSYRLAWPVRRLGLYAAFALVWAYFGLLRFDGVDGSMVGALPYRWTPSVDERSRAEYASRAEPAAQQAEVLQLVEGDSPEFRGPKRDGRLTGVKIGVDWQKDAPREVWRHAVGPGWGSFAVIGDRLYTQEQLEERELVVCYHAPTGKELWRHADVSRFTEPVAGPGPRATPTFHEGKLYTLGAAGKLNCLDAATGNVHWTRDLVADSGATIPNWGFASSPLVVNGIVTVFAGGPDGKAVIAYRAYNGEEAWHSGDGQFSYASLQHAIVDGVGQLLHVSDRGVASFDPGTGKEHWRHDWPVDKLARVTQPAQVGNADFLIGTGFGYGLRRVHVETVGGTAGGTVGGMAASEVWTSQAIKPYFNDFVVHKNHLYGFDGSIFTCLELDGGKKKWRARGYGNGQVLALADQDVLLIQCESGEVAVVAATPDEHKELARMPALSRKTWNHPVIAHGYLFVRNDVEAVCFRLPGYVRK